MSSSKSNPIQSLQEKLSEQWPAIDRAHVRAAETAEKLDKALEGLASTDAAVVVFGSLARKEWTSKSDVDWTLLIDGQADPEPSWLGADCGQSFGRPGICPTGYIGHIWKHDVWVMI